MKTDIPKCEQSEQPQEKPINRLRVGVTNGISEMLRKLSLNE